MYVLRCARRLEPAADSWKSLQQSVERASASLLKSCLNTLRQIRVSVLGTQSQLYENKSATRPGVAMFLLRALIQDGIGDIFGPNRQRPFPIGESCKRTRHIEYRSHDDVQIPSSILISFVAAVLVGNI
mmetsp:Transcript_33315/g.88466  ORF Transcript_33315/g.88466 Transcript_33315/m.88466 type:complete len:129 (-) Transcript_33315:402-788(-)